MWVIMGWKEGDWVVEDVILQGSLETGLMQSRTSGGGQGDAPNLQFRV